MIIRFLVIFLIVSTTLSCDQTNNNSAGKAGQPATSAPVGQQLYPSIPEAVVKDLFTTCDYVDFIFYTHSFSMNRSQKSDIQNSLSHISAQPAFINASCKPAGRVSFQVNGEIKLDAEMYVSATCNYFVFMNEKNRPQYANTMTPEGITFFNNVFNQVKGTK